MKRIILTKMNNSGSEKNFEDEPLMSCFGNFNSISWPCPFKQQTQLHQLAVLAPAGLNLIDFDILVGQGYTAGRG